MRSRFDLIPNDLTSCAKVPSRDGRLLVVDKPSPPSALLPSRGHCKTLPLDDRGGINGVQKTLSLDDQGENTHPSPLMIKGELKGV